MGRIVVSLIKAYFRDLLSQEALLAGGPEQGSPASPGPPGGDADAREPGLESRARSGQRRVPGSFAQEEGRGPWVGFCAESAAAGHVWGWKRDR